MRLNSRKTRILVAVTLLTFLLVVAASIWLLDLVNEQRTFGFLLSAELLAFSMLVYVYDRTTEDEVNWLKLLIGCAFLAMLIFFSIITP